MRNWKLPTILNLHSFSKTANFVMKDFARRLLWGNQSVILLITFIFLVANWKVSNLSVVLLPYHKKKSLSFANYITIKPV